MYLEHGSTGLRAKFDLVNNIWDIGTTKVYRWLNPDNTPASEWMNDIREAIEWIINYDTKRLENLNESE